MCTIASVRSSRKAQCSWKSAPGKSLWKSTNKLHAVSTSSVVTSAGLTDLWMSKMQPLWHHLPLVTGGAFGSFGNQCQASYILLAKKMKFYKPKLLFYYMQGLNLAAAPPPTWHYFLCQGPNNQWWSLYGSGREKRKEERWTKKEKIAEASFKLKTISYVRAGAEKNIGAMSAWPQHGRRSRYSHQTRALT